MLFDDFAKKVLEILPNATFGEDNDGQIIVYTNMMEVGSEDNFFTVVEEIE